MPLRFTRFGWFYVAFTLGVGAAAINTGNNLLYIMLGLLLGFIILSGFLSDSCLWGARARLEAIGDLYAGQPGEWEMVVHKNWFPGVILEVEVDWDQRVGEASKSRSLFYYVPRYGSASQRISMTPSRRGAFTLKRLRFSTRFPFGLFEKTHHARSDQSWVVFPRVELLPLSLLRAAGLNLADQPAERRGPGATPWDLREYQVGDSSKRIHWKSTAKRGHLMVTETEQESGLSRIVVVSRWPKIERLELFISFVASLVFTLHRQGLSVGLQTPGLFLSPDASRQQLKNILGYLALSDPEKELSLLAPATSGIDALILWANYGR